MKKLIPLIAFLGVAFGAWYFLKQAGDGGGGGSAGTNAAKTPSATKEGSPEEPAAVSGESGALSRGNTGTAPISDADEEDEGEILDDRSAVEVYHSAEEALKAVEAGAKEYDDLILEQFTEPPENCAWCESFYQTLREKTISPQASDDERSYYSELLAISGRVENIKALIQAIESAGDTDAADIYAEGLELTMGNDEVVKYLSTHLGDTNETLQESVVAAISNQSSRLAAETLYEHTVKKGDPDGYYSVGIGLGEFIPDEEALPYLEQLVRKRDDYSPLAVKALTNYGLDGLKMVFDALTNSKDPDSDRKLLKDISDHVAYDDEMVDYLKKTVETSQQPVLVEVSKQVLADLEAEGDDTEEEGELAETAPAPG